MTPIDRDNELAELRDAFQESLQGRGQVVVVTGPVASGKTDLVQVFLGQAVAARAVVLSATASYAERSIPLSVIGQLSRAVALPSDIATRISRLLDDGALTAILGDPDGTAAGQLSAPVLHSLCMAVLELSEREPVVIVVDDFHYVDLSSLQCLSYLVRRLRPARVTVVLCETLRPQPAHPLFDSELMRLPYCRTIRLGMLAVDGVERMLAQHLDTQVAQQLATGCHHLTGGNPLLVRGLIADVRSTWPREPVRLVAGPGFTDAFAACLYRCEFSMLKVARGVAVLGGPAKPALLGRLLDLEPETVVRAVDALNIAGLLADGAFRHPAARTGVLGGLAEEDRMVMHSRAAELAYNDGAPAAVVARQLLAARNVSRPWVLPILYEAAEQSLVDSDLDLALGCLRLAQELATDPQQRAVSRLRLANVEWRTSTAIVLRHLAELAEAVRTGLLTGWRALPPVHWLLWFGRVDEAVNLLDRICASTESADVQTTESIGSTRLWLHGLYPGLRGGSGRGEKAAEPSVTTVATTLRGARLLSAVMTGGPDESTVATAEQILNESPLGERTFATISAALATLVCGDQLSVAGRWCAVLHREAENRRASTWQAVFATLQAEVALRQGDLPSAERHARAALSLISHRGWGVAIGAPLGTLVQALTAMGRFDDAVSQLRVPVPDALFNTPFALHYLRARGWYSLSTGQPAAALTTFRTCGELAARWNLAIPALVPWWSDGAQALLRLGRPDEARTLVRDQLKLQKPGQLRSRGISLRILAATSSLKRRPALLRQSLSALQICGDRLELSHTLTDLARAYYSLGEFSRSNSMLQQAETLIRQCGAKPLDPPASGTADNCPDKATDTRGLAILSDAERRVAELAGQGHTNRQIADKLFVTVSTVEQHLTRVYRKLKVDRREKLPMLGLRWSAPHPRSLASDPAPPGGPGFDTE
nr:AAA family ATPase [Micromonospora sp. DSM 115978]